MVFVVQFLVASTVWHISLIYPTTFFATPDPLIIPSIKVNSMQQPIDNNTYTNTDCPTCGVRIDKYTLRLIDSGACGACKRGWRKTNGTIEWGPARDLTSKKKIGLPTPILSPHGPVYLPRGVKEIYKHFSQIIVVFVFCSPLWDECVFPPYHSTTGRLPLTRVWMVRTKCFQKSQYEWGTGVEGYKDRACTHIKFVHSNPAVEENRRTG